MAVFKCSKCGCKENTATSNFQTFAEKGKPALCSECDPEIGRWHRRFIKKPFSEPFDETKHGDIPEEYRHK